MNLNMYSKMKTIIKALILIYIFSSPVFAQVHIKLTRGEMKKIGISVDKFTANSDTLEKTAQEIREIMQADLEFALYFNVIKNDSSFLTKSKKIDFPAWFSRGVNTLVVGNAVTSKTTKEGVLKIEAYDVFTKRTIIKKTYPIGSNIRSLAHQISDELIEVLAGEKGVNQTKIMCLMRKGNSKEVLISDYDGYNLFQFTKTGELHLSPAWDPQGEYIMFTLYKGANLYLYAMSLLTKNFFVFSSQKGMNTAPAWSPDGRTLAFVLTKDGNPEIYTMNRERKNLKRITFSGYIETSPSWSPTGKEIAFVSDRTGTPQIYIMEDDGSNLRRLTFLGSNNTSPCWSPKGDRIAYVSQEGNLFQIYTISNNGEDEMCLTYDGNNEEPSWSPDGLHLCFVSDRNGRYELFTMHWDGSCQQKQVSLADGCFSSRWSPHVRTAK